MSNRASMPPLLQGELDGLCGIYAIVNFVRQRLRLCVENDRKELRSIFRLAIEGAEGSSSVSMRSLMDGYRQGQLVKGFKAVDSKFKLNVEVLTMRSYAKRQGTGSIISVMRSLDEGEAAIVRLREPNHWVLAFPGSNAQFWVDDSAFGGDRRAIRKSVVEKHKIESQRGLVFRNAQTR